MGELTLEDVYKRVDYAVEFIGKEMFEHKTELEAKIQHAHRRNLELSDRLDELESRTGTTGPNCGLGTGGLIHAFAFQAIDSARNILACTRCARVVHLNLGDSK